ncbi:SDR family NAD(P)-dependent oxidoreductase [Persicobacter sp. CCB-QB2]|uniref:SDR family NAD(P)-dependent oxidoreductase n=1 Tax=Persicobacter sp. CCB-QB2 TaxID=1561025 RepID=UPI0006A95530|nr:SDR family NAD(P)-dependent oxidoreductase [Persicobacter sp. CCB-QB2]
MSKTIFITGSTDGIGKMTAEQLAKKGHEIIIHGRNDQKVQATVESIKTTSGNENIHGIVGDLSEFSTIQNLISDIKSRFSKIDILINNAGVFKSINPTNHTGQELRFMVNYLAPYALTYGLMPLLKNGEDARIINLSSAAQAPVSLKALEGKSHLSQQETYAQSKLALTMWSFYLAQQEPELNIIAVNPGSLLNTRMAREAYGTFWSPANKGADILYQLALSTEVNGASGQYFDNDMGNFNRAHGDAYASEKIRLLIDSTQKIIKEYIPSLSY